MMTKFKIQKDWPTLTKSEEGRRILGSVGHYRKFIKDFSKTIRSKTIKKKKTKIPEWELNQVQEQAFATLKQCLLFSPILSYHDFDLSFEVHTDAGSLGLGAVL